MAAEVVLKSCNLFISQPSHQNYRRRNNNHASMSLKSSESSNSQFYGRRIILTQPPPANKRSINPRTSTSQIMMMSLCIGKAQKWWEKGHQSNMTEITSAQQLADSLSSAGDQLVVLDFFSPGCGGCKALHPKICQLAEMNPEVQFLQVNYEEHKSMCYSLNVHVLPFFRFYRGAHGRLCSFSCTNATIKKFRDALAKHSPDRCSLGPAKGLEEKELIALSANKDLSFSYTPKPVEAVPVMEEILAETSARSTSESNSMLPLPNPSTFSKEFEDKTLVTAGR